MFNAHSFIKWNQNLDNNGFKISRCLGTIEVKKGVVH